MKRQLMATLVTMCVSINAVEADPRISVGVDFRILKDLHSIEWPSLFDIGDQESWIVSEIIPDIKSGQAMPLLFSPGTSSIPASECRLLFSGTIRAQHILLGKVDELDWKFNWQTPDSTSGWDNLMGMLIIPGASPFVSGYLDKYLVLCRVNKDKINKDKFEPCYLLPPGAEEAVIQAFSKFKNNRKFVNIDAHESVLKNQALDGNLMIGSAAIKVLAAKGTSSILKELCEKLDERRLGIFVLSLLLSVKENDIETIVDQLSQISEEVDNPGKYRALALGAYAGGCSQSSSAKVGGEKLMRSILKSFEDHPNSLMAKDEYVAVLLGLAMLRPTDIFKRQLQAK